MDYKELTNQLEVLERHTGFCVLGVAATAIETLLDERDAAAEDLRGLCWCCANGKKYESGLPWSKATTCEHMQELGVVARSGGKCKCKFWKWRGLREGDGYD